MKRDQGRVGRHTVTHCHVDRGFGSLRAAVWCWVLCGSQKCRSCWNTGTEANPRREVFMTVQDWEVSCGGESNSLRMAGAPLQVVVRTLGGVGFKLALKPDFEFKKYVSSL